MKRLNPFDLLVLLALFGAAGTGVLAYRRFQVPAPTIAAVVPGRLAPADRRLTIHGDHLQPFLQTFVEPAGQPLVMDPVNPLAHQAITISSSSAELVVELPALTTGTYDIYLCDEFERLAFMPQALVVAEPDLPRAVVGATIRFYVWASIAQQIAAGDRDTSTAGAPRRSDEAVVTAVRADRDGHDELEMRVAAYVAGDASVWMGLHDKVTQLDVDVRVPLVRDDRGEWRYEGRLMRAGETMPFETSRFSAAGTIVSIGMPEPVVRSGGAQP